ncbi:MAG: proprotein convertase P-domain-containing protein [Bryobacteraceae bacterium]|jgi:uncharacterized protein (TIGR03437 family)
MDVTNKKAGGSGLASNSKGMNNTFATIAFLLLFGSSFEAQAQQPVTVTYTYSNLPLRIFPSSSNTVTVATIVMPRAIKMTKVTAQLQIQYPDSGDLKVYLYSPQLTRTILLQNDCDVANVDTTFDDSAQSSWSEVCPVQAGLGPFQADEPLANFNTDNSSYGLWELTVQNDRSTTRTGWVTQFSLTISGTSQTSPITSSQTILNNASGAGEGSIAPGELISIFGLNLGPSTGVSAPAGPWPTTLGGTTVSINGTPAPLNYSSSFEVQVQTPFDLTTGSLATLQLSFNNQPTPPILLTVLNAVPGVYTRGAAGTGPVSATNQDGSANSPEQPAPKGSVIVIYASGLGVVDPPVPAGSVPPLSPLSTVVGRVGASVGGVAAAVQFAGLAPGIPGVYQLNIQVPLNAPSGTQELIVANGNSSQKLATIEVQ